MFEKEAEEYANNTRTRKENEVIVIVDDWGVKSLTPDERHLWQGISDRQKARKEGFLKGAEFGYNKANEWHSVYDELPKENKKYWVLTSSGEPKVADWLSVSWVYPYDIVAWKEIIKPKGVAE